MQRVLMVWTSTTGGTRQMVDAAAQGARDAASGVDVLVQHARDTTVEDVLAARGLVFATPEHLASMAGLMKDFFDRTYYGVLGHLVGRPHAVLVCAGSDGEPTVRQLNRIALGWRLRAVVAPVVVITHAQTPEAILAPKTISPVDLARCRDVGATLAAGVDAGIF